LDLGEVTQIWRNGCIIRAVLLDDIYRAVEQDGNCLLMHEKFRSYIQEHRSDMNRTLADIVEHSVSAPCLSSVVSYLNAYTDLNSSANLLQAQRDFFGAHTYERRDREGIFHTIWECKYA